MNLEYLKKKEVFAMEAMKDVRRLAIVGTGFVGMSFAYSMVNQGTVDELVLIDLNKEKAEGEAMDLNHGIAFAPSTTRVFAGNYADCEYVDIVVITAGAPQLPGETRLDLAAKNAKIIKSITEEIMKHHFDGIIIVASNPVDLMTYVVQKVSGLPPQRVFGSGTVLDTSRLRYLLGNYTGVSSQNIHAHIMGEHGDSSFVPWSNTYVSTQPLLDYLKKRNIYSEEKLEDIYVQVRDAAYKIIEAKKATYYGIGMGLTSIVQAIFNDANKVMTVSAKLTGQYGHEDMYIGVPAVITRQGITDILTINLTDEEQAKFDASAEQLKNVLENSVKPVL